MRSQKTASHVFELHALTPALMGIDEFKTGTGNHDHSQDGSCVLPMSRDLIILRKRNLNGASRREEEVH